MSWRWLELIARVASRVLSTVVAEPGPPAASARRLLFEQLEDRCVPAGGFDFAAPVDYARALGESRVAIADFNNDGNLDVAATSPGVASAPDPPGVYVRLGDGTGALGPAAHFSVNSEPFGVVAADFNGDGAVDLATANYGNPSFPSSNRSISVILGNGAGGFGPATKFSVGTRARAIGAADFDNDGDVDLAVKGGGLWAGAGLISVILGDGVGGFGPYSVVATDVFGSQTLAAYDFNRDGNVDIAAGSATVPVLFGDGSGGFGPPSRFAAGPLPTVLAAADLDADGLTDIVAANGGTAQVSVLLGDPTAILSPPVTYPLPRRSGWPAPADFDGDGDIDIAMGAFMRSSPDPGYALALMAGDGGGSLGPFEIVFDRPFAWTTIVSADLNNDGKPDLLGTDADRLSVILNGRPDAVLASAPAVGNDSDPASYEIGVTYTDNVGIDLATLDDFDIRVTGPGDFETLAQFLSVNQAENGSPRTATYRITAPGDSWDIGENGAYTIILNPLQVDDVAGASVPAAVLGSFVVNVDFPPTAMLAGAPDVDNGSDQEAYDIEVVFTDDGGIDVASVGAGDVRVMGPNGFEALGELVAIEIPEDGSPRTARYRIAPPGGSWDFADSGVYTITLEPDQVTDTAGLAAEGGVLGTFTVAIQLPPAAELASAPDVDDASPLRFYELAVRYTDEEAIDVSMIWTSS